MEDKELYDAYLPEVDTRADVHSSYFQLLAENGFPALGLFLSMLLWCLFTLQRLIFSARGDPGRAWVADYASMLQIGLCAYVVSAAFLERAFFDLLYQLVGAVIVLKDLARGEAVAAVSQPETAAVAVPVGAALPRGVGGVTRRAS
jgi:O-antigen ligase